MTYKKVRKRFDYGGMTYDANGNPIPASTTPKSSTIGQYSQAANFAGDLVSNIGGTSEVGEIGGSALKGAGTGAAAGAVFGPEGAIIGGAVGLVGGAISGVIQHNKENQAKIQQAQNRERQRVAMQNNNDQQVLSQYNVNGNREGGYYKYGGRMKYPYGGDTTRMVNMGYNVGPLSPKNPLLVEKRNGTIAQWGNPILPNTTPTMQGAPVILPSDKALGQSSMYYPSNMNRTTPTPAVIPHYGAGGSINGLISGYHTGNIITGGKSYAEGGTIHIKSSHKGRFTAWKARTGETTEQALHSSNPHVRQMANFANNASKWKHAYGGLTSDSYTDPEVYAEGGAIPLASDTQKFVGPSHAQGGIPIDPNQDGHAEAEVEGGEVQKDNQIYSDRLKPTPQLVQVLKENKINPDGTYADIAARLGKMKGRYETKLTTHSPIAERTGQSMVGRVDQLMQEVFQDQEQSKATQPTPQMANGGMLSGTKMMMYDDGGDLGLTDETTLPPKGHIQMRPPIMRSLSPYGQNYDQFANNAVAQQQANLQAQSAAFTQNNSLARQIAGQTVPVTPSTPLVKSNAPHTLPSTGRKVNPRFAQLSATQENTPLVNTGVQGQVSSTPVTGSVDPSLLPVQAPVGDTPSTMDNVSSYISKYGADALNVASYFGNQAAINRMKAPQLQLNPDPHYIYNDRSGLAKNENEIAAQGAARGITNTSAQGRQAQKAQIYAEQIAGNNQINQAENLRRDSYNQSYDSRVQQNNAVNTDIRNKQADIDTQVNNEKIAMGVQNRNTLNAGEINNQSTRDREALDDRKSALILAASQDPVKLTKLLAGETDPKRIRMITQMMRGLNVAQ